MRLPVCSTPPVLRSTSCNACPAVRTLQLQCGDAWWQSCWQTPSLEVSYPLPLLQAFSPRHVIIVSDPPLADLGSVCAEDCPLQK
uniref:Uncharacterized protein n=1 Tax=Accipiter nisus TaxID=211598 RepID=A0A8B9NLM0_9AVES